MDDFSFKPCIAVVYIIIILIVVFLCVSLQSNIISERKREIRENCCAHVSVRYCYKKERKKYHKFHPLTWVYYVGVFALAFAHSIITYSKGRFEAGKVIEWLHFREDHFLHALHCQQRTYFLSHSEVESFLKSHLTIFLLCVFSLDTFFLRREESIP